jgi:hypothetical protein
VSRKGGSCKNEQKVQDEVGDARAEGGNEGGTEVSEVQEVGGWIEGDAEVYSTVGGTGGWEERCSGGY